MSRRALVSTVALAAALVASAAPLLTASSAAGCPTWTDAKGDATTFEAPVDQAYDANLDILGATLSTTADTMTAVIKVAKLTETASDTGDEFFIDFTLGGKDLEIYSDRGTDVLLDTFGTGAGFYNYTDQSSVNGAKATYDVKASTVTIVGKLSDLSKLAGFDVAGKSATSLVAGTTDLVGLPELGSQPLLPYDEAPAPTAATLAVGSGCGGGGGPAPTPTPTPSPSPSPTTPPPPAGAFPADLPRAGCFHVVDPVGDAKIDGEAPNDADLDITGMTLRSSGGWVLAYLKVDKLGAGPLAADGHRYSIDFTFNKHVFTVAASAYKDAQSETIREGLASTGKNGHMVQMSVDSVSTISAGTAVAYASGQVNPPYVASGSKAVFDTKSGYVTIAIPVADIEKYGQAKLTTLTAVTGKSSADYWRNSLGADTTAKDNASASTDTWTVGDNKCFPQPVATALSLAVTKAGNARTVTAKLTSAGKPLGGQTIVWSINGKKVGTATTASNGTAVLKTAKPTQTVTAEFAGVADTYLPSKATAKV